MYAKPHLHGGRVHEVEGDEVVDAHGLEGENGGGQVGALDLRHGRGQHLVPVGTLSVQPVALARASTPSPACPLLCLSLKEEWPKDVVYRITKMVFTTFHLIILNKSRLHTMGCKRNKLQRSLKGKSIGFSAHAHL